MKTLLITVILLLATSPALAQQETINPEILRRLERLDRSYRSPCYQEMLLYKRSFQDTLKEIEIALGEQRCYSEQLLVSDLIAEFNLDDTTMDRILEMNREIGYAVVSCD